MKSICFIVFALISFVAYSQPSKTELKKHRLTVKESRDKHTAVISLDTLFCSGIAQASVTELSSPRGYTVRSLHDSGILISTRYQVEYVKPNSNPELVYKVEFPPVGLACKVKAMQNVQDLICSYGLLNNQALDTVKVETFVVLKGIKSQDAEKPEQPENVLKGRDKKAPLVLSDVNNSVGARDIQQQGVVIGAFKADSTEGPSGMLNRYVIYNSVGAIICNATEIKKDSHDWRLLIDNRFHSLRATPGKDLNDIIVFLINSNLL